MIFFFSSRRRHTRLTCDWSSDVCSSDLDSKLIDNPSTNYRKHPGPPLFDQPSLPGQLDAAGLSWGNYNGYAFERSEERRVGKGCSCRWWADHVKKKTVLSLNIEDKTNID